MDSGDADFGVVAVIWNFVYQKFQIQKTMLANRLVKLRNLLALGQVRIKIMFAVKLAVGDLFYNQKRAGDFARPRR